MRNSSTLLKKSISKTTTTKTLADRDTNSSNRLTRSSSKKCSSQVKSTKKKEVLKQQQLRDMGSDDSYSNDQSTAFSKFLGSPMPTSPIPSSMTYSHTLSDYSLIKEVPIYHPTQEEFSDPFKLIEVLHAKGFDRIGAVKVIPPKNWKPSFCFPGMQKKFPTRTQSIGELTKGKPFVETKSNFTFEEYKAHAESFSQEYKFQTRDSAYATSKERRNEFEYWSIVDNPDFFSEVKVEYAADLSSRTYGSCFDQSNSQKKNGIDSFNLTQVNAAHNSLFQPIKRKDLISGINSPWVYFGMLFSTFCFHVEDIYMYSINYLHAGSAKTWYTVPEQFMSQFEEVYQQTYKGIFDKDRQAMSSMNLQLNPMIAVKAGIPVYRADQQAGQFIITFPKVYHGGFSHGFNCAEAVNVITPPWFKYYYEAKLSYQKAGFQKIMPFPLTWVLSNIVLDSLEGQYDKNFLQKVYKEWKKSVDEELKVRKGILSNGKTKQKLLMISKEIYHKHTCGVCQEYCYFSHIQCNVCAKISCSSHISPCCCLKSSISLYVRYTEKDFENQKKMINDAMNLKK